jgi:hypothetical protein
MFYQEIQAFMFSLTEHVSRIPRVGYAFPRLERCANGQNPQGAKRSPVLVGISSKVLQNASRLCGFGRKLIDTYARSLIKRSSDVAEGMI